MMENIYEEGRLSNCNRQNGKISNGINCNPKKSVARFPI